MKSKRAALGRRLSQPQVGPPPSYDDPFGIGSTPSAATLLGWYRRLNEWHRALVQPLEDVEIYDVPFAVRDSGANVTPGTPTGPRVVPAMALARRRLTEAELDSLYAVIQSSDVGQQLLPRPVARQPSGFPPMPIPTAVAPWAALEHGRRARVVVDSLRTRYLTADTIARYGSRRAALMQLFPRALAVMTGDTAGRGPQGAAPVARRIYFRQRPPWTCLSQDPSCVPQSCDPDNPSCVPPAGPESELSPDSSVVGAVFYPWFNADVLRDSVRVPPELVALLEVERQRLERQLPDTLRALTVGWRMMVPDTVVARGAPFWVRALPAVDQYGHHAIQVSPVMVRAVFIRAVDHIAFLLPEFASVETLPDRRQLHPSLRTRATQILRSRPVNAWRDVLSGVGNRFLGPFRFALAHEMAHVYLGRSGAALERRELPCDCYAVWHLRRAGYPSDPGVFTDLGLRSIREGSAGLLWGHSTFHDAAALKTRSDSIRSWIEEPDVARLASRCAAVWRSAPPGS